jgi:hypothetical protein
MVVRDRSCHTGSGGAMFMASTSITVSNVRCYVMLQDITKSGVCTLLFSPRCYAMIQDFIYSDDRVTYIASTSLTAPAEHVRSIGVMWCYRIL